MIVRPRPAIGRCPQCKGLLFKMLDVEKRAWANCIDCGAQFPLKGTSNPENYFRKKF